MASRSKRPSSPRSTTECTRHDDANIGAERFLLTSGADSRFPLGLEKAAQHRGQPRRRASAVREILKRGLVAEGFAKALAGSKSSDFGLSAKVPGGRTAK